MSSRLVLSVAVVALVAITCCSGASKDLSPEKLKKSYAKINEYLNNKLPKYEGPEADLAKVEEMLAAEQSSCMSILNVGSLIKTLKMILKMAHMPDYEELCYMQEGHKLMATLDSGLIEDSKEENSNYPPSRVEKLLWHYALKNTRECSYGVKFSENVVWAYKKHSYDLIEKRLISELPNDDDFDKNLAKAEEMLNSLDSRDGALAVALEQFISLKRTLSEDTCNVEGFNILYANDLATKGNAHSRSDKPKRRIDRIFQHYAREHERICQPIMREVTFKEELKKLDLDTFRKILVLAGSQYLDIEQYQKLVEQVNGKQNDGEFTAPILVETFEESGRKNAARGYTPALLRLPPAQIRYDHIYHYIKAISASDPESQCLVPVVDAKTGEKTVDMNKVEQLLEKHLFEPCRNFLGSFVDLIYADNYGSLMNEYHTRSLAENFVAEAGYHLVRMGVGNCQNVEAKGEDIVDGVRLQATKS